MMVNISLPPADISWAQRLEPRWNSELWSVQRWPWMDGRRASCFSCSWLAKHLKQHRILRQGLVYAINQPHCSVSVPLVGVLTWVFARAGGVGVPALPVEEDPGGHGCGVHRGSPAAAALLAAWVGRQGHLHTHLSEERTHTAAQEHGEKTQLCFFSHRRFKVEVVVIRGERATWRL